MRPGNRQAVLRWIKDIQSSKSAISPYLQRAAGFSDTSGSEIIMAIDLAGGFSWERAAKYLNGKPELLKKYGAEVNDAATVLRSVEGVRVGIRLGDEPFAKIVLDFPGGVKASPEAAKELLLEIFADLGVKLDEFDQWKCEVTPKEVSLGGTLSREGLRRMNSLIDSPAPANVAADGDKYVSPGQTAGDKAAASVQYFQTVSKMFDDIKKGWRDLNNIASGAGFLDRYAARIDKLPVLNVDEDLLDYGQYVSTQLRAGANAVRTLGIRGGAREAQVTGYDVGPSVVGYGGGAYGGYYGGYRSGWVAYDYPSGHDVIKQVGSERRKIRAEEKGVMATNVYAIRDQILDATAKIRRMQLRGLRVRRVSASLSADTRSVPYVLEIGRADERFGEISPLAQLRPQPPPSPPANRSASEKYRAEPREVFDDRQHAARDRRAAEIEVLEVPEEDQARDRSVRYLAARQLQPSQGRQRGVLPGHQIEDLVGARRVGQADRDDGGLQLGEVAERLGEPVLGFGFDLGAPSAERVESLVQGDVPLDPRGDPVAAIAAEMHVLFRPLERRLQFDEIPRVAAAVRMHDHDPAPIRFRHVFFRVRRLEPQPDHELRPCGRGWAWSIRVGIHERPSWAMEHSDLRIVENDCRRRQAAVRFAISPLRAVATTWTGMALHRTRVWSIAGLRFPRSTGDGDRERANGRKRERRPALGGIDLHLPRERLER